MKSANKDFMLLCGFEKFDDIYVRIDILEVILLIFNLKKMIKRNKSYARNVKLARLFERKL